MSFPSSAASPASDAGFITLPAKLSAPSPANSEVTPPPAPPITLPISIPSFSPLVAPTLPNVAVGGTTPPPTSPLLSPPLPTPTLPPTSQPQPQLQPQPQPQPQPQLEPQPQPPLTSPPPTAQSTPPPDKTDTPNIIPPPLSKPLLITPPPKKETAPPQKETPPPNIISPPLSNPVDITPPPQKETPPPTSISPPLSKPVNKPPPPTSNPTIPSSPPSPPSSRQPKTRPATQPSPSQPGPLRPKATPTASRPPSPLPTSATLPSSPPVALPVPQSPGGGAWIPFSAEAPTPLPEFPTPPGTSSSPAVPLHGSSGGASSLSSDHQNIQAAAAAPKGSSNGANGLVVGMAVGGILLLLVAVVFSILLVFCKRREKKKFDEFGSGRKHASVFTESEEKSTLPLYTKQIFNGTQGLETMANVINSKEASMAISGTPLTMKEFTPGSGPTLSSGTFTYEELMMATNNFSEQNLLGQGGFGYVHKGIFPNGKEVAVKQLKMGGHQGEREFRAEVETISQVHHKHLVSLVGYCIAGAERLLIYEFVPNNTLEFHLHGEGQPVMDWPTRLKIAIGSAKGLAYLHEDCSPSVIHRDIKAANILLDCNSEAKVSDFGLAKIFSSGNPSVTHMTTRVVGTFGYLAPEYASSGKVTDKSDIYSYGVMLLELITGRPPISNFGSATCGSLVNWARPLLAQAIGTENFESLADPRLQNNYDIIGMASMVACAAACVRLSAWRRPKMSQVVRALEGNLPTSELDDGTRPGQSLMHFPYESLDFDARKYIEDMKRMAMTDNSGNNTTSRYSENTSEYGLHPSASSTDTSQPSRS